MARAAHGTSGAEGGGTGIGTGPTLGLGAHTGAIAGAVLVAGAVLPAAGGILWTTIAAVVAFVLASSRLRARGSWGWPALLRPRRPGLRVGLAGATWFAAIVLAAVAARVVAQIVIAFPAALPAVALVLVLALARPGEGWLRWLWPPALVVLALLGARCEANGAQARGGMHSGAIHGIHPFQTTAVVVDGYGPFDLPINDYVEPQGGRGYDPTELALAIELALHRIAEVHFADGPERARVAFADATVGAVVTDPILERLDREAPPGPQPRFWVNSGSTGQRSRVEFVCPGRRDDPRPAPAETVMNRMCPDKYANEASAGLSVTGRWPGYVEIHGNERMGLSQWLGWTRSDDAAGRGATELESWLWVMMVLLVAAVAVLAGGGLGAQRLGVAAAPIALPLVAVMLIAALAHSDLGVLPLVARTPTYVDPWQPSMWQGVLVWPALAALSSWVVRPGAGRVRAGGIVLFGALVLVWLASSDLSAPGWLAPAWHVPGTTGAIETWVIALAEAAWWWCGAWGISIFELEAVVAAAIAAPCVVAVVHLVHASASATRQAWPELPPRGAWMLGALLVVLGALALAWSRKTSGGVALIPAAIGVALVCGSALQRIAARGPWPTSHASLLATLAHLGWTALALWLVGSTAPQDGDPLRWLYTGLAAIAALAPMLCCIGDPEPAITSARAGTPPPKTP